MRFWAFYAFCEKDMVLGLAECRVRCLENGLRTIEVSDDTVLLVVFVVFLSNMEILRE